MRVAEPQLVIIILPQNKKDIIIIYKLHKFSKSFNMKTKLHTASALNRAAMRTEYVIYLTLVAVQGAVLDIASRTGISSKLRATPEDDNSGKIPKLLHYTELHHRSQ